MLVANLDDRNDDRTEVATLEREIVVLEQNSERGDMSLDELRADLRRVRLYAGIDPASGPGVSIVVRGPIDGPGIEDLVNELRGGKRWRSTASALCPGSWRSGRLVPSRSALLRSRSVHA